eukprot:TRINITY_DN55922_c0_g1_i1.p1 TRINITY_DN55922_c0_g1~~TRINITY_DN55922_c0_g1_i1.p1  ORF type:complete len:324 (+),score=29.37 TRINITY_DN55922_c0_g1_i1:87-974(+)
MDSKGFMGSRVFPVQAGGTDAVGPEIVLDLPDLLVLDKPPHWEVYDRNFFAMPSRQLLSFLSEIYPCRQNAILDDAEHRHGFLHRLDVPSSGLVLWAKTRKAYYHMVGKLHAGEMQRDYVTVCHGFVSALLHTIRARVYWRGQSATIAGDRGRPARSRPKVLSHAVRDGQAFSLLAVRIESGRQHQIRSHLAYVGHPTLSDGKYTSNSTFDSDVSWLRRNFLHRYRLAFRDSFGRFQDVSSPVPEELRFALSQLLGKSDGSVQSIVDLLSNPVPRAWDTYTPLQDAPRAAAAQQQ